MGVLVDTSVLMHFERAGADLSAIIAGREEDDVMLSVVSASELLHGVHRAEDADVRARRSAWVEALLTQLPILPIDLETSRAHARLWADLAGAGTPIGPHDLWLAASAVARGLHLATHNAREFSRVPGLVVEVWGRAGEAGGA